MKLSLPSSLSTRLFSWDFTGITGTYQKESLFHSPPLYIGDADTDEFHQQLGNGFVTVDQRLQVLIKYRCWCGSILPVTGNLNGG